MKEKNLAKTQLRTSVKIIMNTVAKLTRNKMVSLNILVRSCEILEYQLNDRYTIDFGEKV